MMNNGDKIQNLKIKLITPPYYKSPTYMEDEQGNVYSTIRTVYSWGRQIGFKYEKHPIRRNKYTTKSIPDIPLYVTGIVKDIRNCFCINGWDYIDKPCIDLTRCKFKLDENYIYDNIDILIEEPEIIRNQKLPEYILNKAVKNDTIIYDNGLVRSLNYFYISRFQTLSEEFIMNNVSKLELKHLLKNHLNIPAKRKIKMLSKLL